MSDWDEGAGGIVRLDGEWEFYWERLLAPEDFRNAGTAETGMFVYVPNE